ncbi:hypothetical protein SAMN05421820_105216 [Pedobacter steynii]|uniref:Uncharacterized protein n=1 Tax=Pedobacter steynii TaxID=430522 RepID=A0A1G9WM57_9SPHI|nr:hypothetical protein SAMN05421820_105216 [Pedobacter steynii]
MEPILIMRSKVPGFPIQELRYNVTDDNTIIQQVIDFIKVVTGLKVAVFRGCTTHLAFKIPVKRGFRVETTFISQLFQRQVYD